jgi:hypothetical protein
MITLKKARSIVKSTRRYKSLWFLILLPFLLIGCTSGITYIKTSGNYQIYSMNPMQALSGGDMNIKILLTSQAVQNPEGKISYNFIVEEKAYKKYFIDVKEDKSLIILNDDDQYTFKIKCGFFDEIPPGTRLGLLSSRLRFIDESGLIIEKVSYSTTLDIIEKIANSQNVEVYILGKDDRLEKKKLLPAHYESFKDFVNYAHNNLED